MNTFNDLPIYSLVINDESETGVDYVALVKAPAIERNFQAFADRVKFSADDARKIVTGPLMIPNQLIFRRDEQFGEYYVTYDKDTVEKIALKFMANSLHLNVNKEHKTPVDGVFMFESFLTDSSRGINAPKGFEDCAEGTWFGSYKVENEAVWKDVMEGNFKGFSVEGDFIHAPYQAKKEFSAEVVLIDEILAML
jgi:hypothetical protein